MVGLAQSNLVDSPETGALAREGRACFHCGEPCADASFVNGLKAFCCQGCLLIHELLTENGLEQFYDLSAHPGIRVRRAAPREQWAYLDEPALQQRLLDFTDGKISRITLQIPAIHCIACVWLLENLFRLHPGIGRAQVNFLRRELLVSFANSRIALSELVALLASLGYEPRLTLGELERPGMDPSTKRQWLQIGIAGFAFGNIMLFSLPGYLGLDSFSGSAFKILFGYLSLGLAIPVLAYSASDYWRSALVAFQQRMVTLDVPIVLGLAALYAQSAYEVIFARGDGYLDSLSGLVFLLLCGRVFQQKTHHRLAFDRDYKCFFPLSAVRKTVTGEENVTISNLRVGNRLLVRNGELIPADARLVSGPACFDYSFVTGESEPVSKVPGDYVYAGGKQVGGMIELEIVKPVSQSYLTSLWNHEAFQKDSEDDLNTITNRYSRRFTRIVIGVAVGAALFWLISGNTTRAMKALTSVLIVACPCALALAAPFTFGTAQRSLARIRVFLKNALVLERISKVESIVFDKTGTLTEASASDVSFQGLSGSHLAVSEAAWICSLTRHSIHPHSVRIGDFLSNDEFPKPTRSFIETPGRGIQGNVAGHEILLGSHAWLASSGVETLEINLPVGSQVFLAIDGKFRGVFVLSNTLRPEIGEFLQHLGRQYEIALLSGDNEKDSERFQNLFVTRAQLHFNQSPLDKLSFIHRLQEKGKTVMMVGDGLNDSGALKQSDVGVAVVEKFGAFSPASDVILEASQLAHILSVLTFSRKAACIVRVSFGISALYNLVGISIAAAGILSPLICAVLMPLSSISVVLFACGATKWAARQLASESFAISPLLHHSTDTP